MKRISGVDLVFTILRPIFLFYHSVGKGPWQEVKEIEHLKAKLALWSANPADFRQFMARRYETLKFIGAGHVAGVISIATFLTTGKRGGWIVVGAKACWLLFGAGVALFVLAYWQLFQFEAQTEELIDLSKSRGADERFDRGCSRIAGRNSLFGYFVANAIVFFAIGTTIVFFGILIAQPPS